MRKSAYKIDVIYDALTYLSNFCIREYFLNPASCANILNIGREKIQAIFGDDIILPSISCPHLAYGHISCLGAQVIFPENSDPSVRPFISSIDEGIEKLSDEINFSENSLFIHYIIFCRTLKEYFPEDNVSFSGFGCEGPITTAVLMRGQDFFTDLYDEPLKVKEFLRLVTDSIIKFKQFIRVFTGQSKIDSAVGGLADDFASLISPNLWDEFVVPYWEQYYNGITTGKRRLHAENLSPEHLGYLKKCKIDFYDPSVSSKLNPKNIKESIDIPFSWLLPTFELIYMSKYDIEKWVYGALENGASLIHTELSRLTCEDENYKKVIDFINAAKNIIQ